MPRLGELQARIKGEVELDIIFIKYLVFASNERLEEDISDMVGY